MKTELLDAYLCGDLRGESAAFIEAALKSDAALREVYFQQVRIDAALRVLLEDQELAEVSPSQFADGVMASLAAEQTIEPEPDRRFAKSVLTEILEERVMKPRPLGWWEFTKAAAITAAAAAIAILLMQKVNVSDSERDAVAGSSDSRNRFVARITSQEPGSAWGKPVALIPEASSETGDDDRALNDDGWLRPGRFTLESGIAEVTFNSGARVFLEGPAVLAVERPDRAFLERGRLTAEVPSPASGFVINTPRINVVDIGTRFGVSVEENGDSEVHVMQGVVEVSRLTGNGAPMILVEGLAVRADGRTRSELQVIDYGGDQFALRVPDAEEGSSWPHRFIHYSFNESGGSEIEDLGRGIEGGPFFASLFPDSEQPTRPKRSVGRVGRCLSLTSGERFDSPLLSGFKGGDPLTVGLWVRIPPRPEASDANLILELAGNNEGESTTGASPPKDWQLRCNASSFEGTEGALRLESGEGFIIGSTDLRDGRWHHVGFRFVGGQTPDLASHLHLYVDGQLEDVSGYQGGLPSSADVVRLQIGGAEGEGGFEGAVDEVFVFPEAVTPNVFQELSSPEIRP